MGKRTIQIELDPTGAVGTRALVITKRFLRAPHQARFVCWKSAPITGGMWINLDTGVEANMDLETRLNVAAQAAAALAGVIQGWPSEKACGRDNRQCVSEFKAH